MELEQLSPFVLERQREALAHAQSVDGFSVRRDEEHGAEAEPAEPAVGRWGAEWPS